MELKALLYEVEDNIATITLNRPKRMNAWTGRMHSEYRWALLQAEQDDDIRAIIVTGSEHSFCVGADARALEGHVEKGGYDPGTPDPLAKPGFGVRPEFDANFSYHFGLTKPVVAMINGPAAGVGLVLACYADIRFAIPGVKLTTAHGKLNLPAEFGLSWLLPRLIGLTRANDLLLSSRKFTSEEALQLGLINRLIEPHLLISETRTYLLDMIHENSPGSLKMTKRQIYHDQHRAAAAAVIESEKLLNEMMQMTDYREGVAAFLEKRKPRWLGE
ncbi:MAG: enoyl-CoA hydratase [Gammaproteobacteria bacterium]|jgi:enoyl-CoA hydratase/carnithine racemase|nr:enoyl-CoA hydratase [Gammaproteobacteria bacterium]MBT5202714.1 enoyl-CoA hydratase [Gammaproteobacteria bacterium]MBT6245737.1 enoyl-CoA hydratase [Gammaproteobacteria bacterium]